MSITIGRGETRTIDLQIVSLDTDRPMDLSTVTAIKVCLPKVNGEILEKTLSNGVSILHPVFGEITVGLSASETETLRLEERQDFDIEITFGATKRFGRARNQLTVVASTCP